MYILTNEHLNEKDEFKLDTSLTCSKTFEEEMEEQRKIELAISHLEALGVEVRIEYGGYRNIYNVLKDLGECLDKQANKIRVLKGEKND